MFSYFKSKPHSVLGVDISPTAVKILELSNQGSSPVIDGYGSALLPAHVIEANMVKNSDLLAQAIVRLLDQLKISRACAVIALPDHAIIRKTIRIKTGLQDSDLEALVWIEAEKYLGSPLNKINIDFSILGPSLFESDMLDILLFASRAEQIDSRLAALNKAGLDVSVVEVESNAIVRAMSSIVRNSSPPCGEQPIVVLFYFDPPILRLLVMKGKQTLINKEERLGLYFSEQEGAREAQILPQSPITRILDEIKRDLPPDCSIQQEQIIDHIFLAGSLSGLAQLAQLIQDESAIATSVVNLFGTSYCLKKTGQEQGLKLSASFLLAYGLALRGLSRS